MNKVFMLTAAIFPAFVVAASSVSLDGEWDFKYFADAAEYGQAAEGNVEWQKITVPSNWELKGFGRFSYGSEKARNVSEQSRRPSREAKPAILHTKTGPANCREPV